MHSAVVQGRFNEDRKQGLWHTCRKASQGCVSQLKAGNQLSSTRTNSSSRYSCTSNKNQVSSEQCSNAPFESRAYYPR